MSSSSANASSGGSASLPRLGPGWYRGAGNQGGKGFQPPPAVPAERRARSGSHGSSQSNDSGRQQNKFSVLDDEEDNIGGAVPIGNSRSEALRTAETGRSRSTGKASGRSLADLAARAPTRESSGYHRKQSGNEDGGGRFTGLKDSSEGRMIRYTREKLLSMRPQPKPDPPHTLDHLAGSPLLSKVAQDPVCWDTFDGDEIWAQAARERVLRASLKNPPSGPPPGVERTTELRRGSSGGVSVGGGRWQRGVALPPPEQRGRSMSRGSEGDDLWDDPGSTTGAASDFSAFGAIPDDPKKESSGGFDFSDMAEASKRFDEELHGRSEGGTSDGEDGIEESHMVSVDPERPLADTGTTIRSGSGDDVNVFEDFDEEGNENEPTAIRSGDADPSASSRLMKMIGVEGTNEAGAVSSAWASDAADPQKGATLASSIPSNPWGDPVIAGGAPQQQEGIDLSARLEAAVAEQKAREAQLAAEMEKRRQQESEMLRRQQEGEAQRRAHLAQQEQQARQQAGMQQQPPPQQQASEADVIERVLMERICTFLENSWGRSDGISILSALHAEDSRVIPLLGNVDSLRALVARHPRRVSVQQDPSMGGEMFVLLMTNSQFQQYQRAEQEEIQRRQQQERAQAMQAAAARAQAAQQREAAAAAAQSILPDAPWFYADPQNNIQGPFKGSEMRQWLDAGYFKGDLPISQQTSGPFRPLSVVFPDLKMAFQVPESQPTQDDVTKADEAERLRKADEARITSEKLRVEAEAAANRQIEAEEAAAAAAAAEQNESSTQLKAILGLEGVSQENAEPSVPPESVPQAPASKRSQQAEKRSQAKQSAKAQKRKEEKAAAAPIPMPKQTPQPSATSSSPPSAWGGAATSAPRSKSMSEIQQEEARRAAILAMERKSAPRQSGGGWANVAARGGGSTGWSSGSVKPLPPAVVTNPNVSMPQARAKQHSSQAQAKQAQVGKNSQQSNAASSKDAFGAEGRMSPSLETWCKEQMRKLNGSDDLTLVSFCMTLTDAEEIRQYFTTYLGSTSQVNNFANEFISRKGGKSTQDEWETLDKAKKGRKKKGGGK